MSISVVAFNIYKYFVVNGLLKGLLAQPDIYADFNFLAKWSKVFQNSAGLALFAAWIKVFKFISFNKTMSQLSGTITKVGKFFFHAFGRNHVHLTIRLGFVTQYLW